MVAEPRTRRASTPAPVRASRSVVGRPGGRHQPTTGDVNLLLVHQQDIQAVVNALWRGGAEAVTVEGQRIVSTTGIKCEGNAVQLRGRALPQPYVIPAVGDQGELLTAIEGTTHLQAYRASRRPTRPSRSAGTCSRSPRSWPGARRPARLSHAVPIDDGRRPVDAGPRQHRGGAGLRSGTTTPRAPVGPGGLPSETPDGVGDRSAALEGRHQDRHRPLGGCCRPGALVGDRASSGPVELLSGSTCAGNPAARDLVPGPALLQAPGRRAPPRDRREQ